MDGIYMLRCKINLNDYLRARACYLTIPQHNIYNYTLAKRKHEPTKLINIFINFILRSLLWSSVN